MQENLEKLFGVLLKQLRLAKGISQESLAYDSELDRTFISLLERGERQPTIATIFKLAKSLGTKPSEMVKSLEEQYENREN